MKILRWGSLAALLLMAAATEPAVGEARMAFGARLAGLKETKMLQIQFTCTREIQDVETVLTSAGGLWVRAGNHKAGTAMVGSGGGGAVHIRTETPYRSETILRDGKFAGRTQHEGKWQVSNQSSTPGLTAVMGQIAGWCVGDAGRLDEWFSVERGAGEGTTEAFLLSPRNPDLQKTVKHVMVTFDAQRATRVRITTAQGDRTTYDFTEWQANGAIPADVFNFESK